MLVSSGFAISLPFPYRISQLPPSYSVSCASIHSASILWLLTDSRAGTICNFATQLKFLLHYDDALDVFASHAVGVHVLMRLRTY